MSRPRRQRGLRSVPETHRHNYEQSLRIAENDLDAALRARCGSRRAVLAMDALAGAAQANVEYMAAHGGSASIEAQHTMQLARQAILSCGAKR